MRTPYIYCRCTTLPRSPPDVLFFTAGRPTKRLQALEPLSSL
ncbi:hypothetical protein T12_3187 [Trichinella patagoniensis]|uniref:Uncharacterized protein n=1 Tax=Trichinella patagoniensis TaxID=990121 RepID=A0A0V0ZYN2_9BILA|nr:hypothetical protein T12_3187 [Trichinella patagoniensis]